MRKQKKRVIVLLLVTALVLSGCSLFKSNKQVTQPSGTTPSNTTPSNTTPGFPGGNTAPETNKPAELDPNPDYYFDLSSKNPSAWQVAYWDFLDRFIDEHVNNSEDPSNLYNSSGYFLADIDDAYNTFVPELCIKHGTCEADFDLWVYAYDQASGDIITLADNYEIPAGHTSFAQGPNGDLYAYGGHMGYLWVTHYWNISGDIQSENVYEQNLNEEESAEDYDTISEILGEDIELFTEFELGNEAALAWYPNYESPTTDYPVDASELFDQAINDEIEVYAVPYSERFYTGKTGLMKMSELSGSYGSTKYFDGVFNKDCFCDTDVNFDGQDERLVAYWAEGGDTLYILLSYQDGAVYAYVFDYLFAYKGDLYVTNYSVFHNWYIKSSDDYGYYVGFVFDKDKCQYLYSTTEEGRSGNPKAAPANNWIYFIDYEQ
ncbi:MAG: hypothetical protein IKI20_04830 [Lachnospiraceae bacterium]|nr:hypothetical protein [Lachnospiraceae bacterium]